MPSGPAITMKKQIEKAREARKGREVFSRPSSAPAKVPKLTPSEKKA